MMPSATASSSSTIAAPFSSQLTSVVPIYFDHAIRAETSRSLLTSILQSASIDNPPADAASSMAGFKDYIEGLSLETYLKVEQAYVDVLSAKLDRSLVASHLIGKVFKHSCQNSSPQFSEFASRTEDMMSKTTSESACRNWITHDNCLEDEDWRQSPLLPAAIEYLVWSEVRRLKQDEEPTLSIFKEFGKLRQVEKSFGRLTGMINWAIVKRLEKCKAENWKLGTGQNSHMHSRCPRPCDMKEVYKSGPSAGIIIPIDRETLKALNAFICAASGLIRDTNDKALGFAENHERQHSDPIIVEEEEEEQNKSHENDAMSPSKRRRSELPGPSNSGKVHNPKRRRTKSGPSSNPGFSGKDKGRGEKGKDKAVDSDCGCPSNAKSCVRRLEQYFDSTLTKRIPPLDKQMERMLQLQCRLWSQLCNKHSEIAHQLLHLDLKIPIEHRHIVLSIVVEGLTRPGPPKTLDDIRSLPYLKSLFLNPELHPFGRHLTLPKTQQPAKIFSRKDLGHLRGIYRPRLLSRSIPTKNGSYFDKIPLGKLSTFKHVTEDAYPSKVSADSGVPQQPGVLDFACKEAHTFSRHLSAASPENDPNRLENMVFSIIQALVRTDIRLWWLTLMLRDDYDYTMISLPTPLIRYIVKETAVAGNCEDEIKFLSAPDIAALRSGVRNNQVPLALTLSECDLEWYPKFNKSFWQGLVDDVESDSLLENEGMSYTCQHYINEDSENMDIVPGVGVSLKPGDILATSPTSPFCILTPGEHLFVVPEYAVQFGDYLNNLEMPGETAKSASLAHSNCIPAQSFVPTSLSFLHPYKTELKLSNPISKALVGALSWDDNQVVAEVTSLRSFALDSKSKSLEKYFFEFSQKHASAALEAFRGRDDEVSLLFPALPKLSPDLTKLGEVTGENFSNLAAAILDGKEPTWSA